MEDYRHRNTLWQSPALQSRLENARVVIGGMGGLGWAIGSALVGLGARHLTVFDCDTLELPNLNRLWGCKREDIGRAKVDVFAEMVKAVDTQIEVAAYREKIPCRAFENALEKADVVFGGYDLPEPRLATQVLARKTKTLYIDVGVAIRQDAEKLSGFGQIFVGKPNESACIVCAGLRLDGIGYRGVSGGPAPSSGVINGILGNMAISVWLKWLGNEHVEQLIRFEWDQLQVFHAPEIRGRENCPICNLSAT